MTTRPPTTHTEVTGTLTNTWSNPSNAGGTHGPSIPQYGRVQIACKLQGFKVADGNTWWYRLAGEPWRNAFYATADAFYNNGTSGGPLERTPFYDPAVPVCP